MRKSKIDRAGVLTVVRRGYNLETSSGDDAAEGRDTMADNIHNLASALRLIRLTTRSYGRRTVTMREIQSEALARNVEIPERLIVDQLVEMSVVIRSGNGRLHATLSSSQDRDQEDTEREIVGRLNYMALDS